MFSVGEYGSIHPEEPYNESSGGGRPLSNNSITDVVASIFITFNFIDSCLQCFESNYTGRTALYK